MRRVLALAVVVLACAPVARAAAPGWSPLPKLLTPREGYSATLLPSGKVLVAGGRAGVPPLASTELFDPATGTWTGGPGMTRERDDFAAVALKDGRVLVIQGELNPSQKSAEVFNPATATWSLTPDMSEKRSGAAASLLPNGNVLVAGGAATYQVYETATNTWRAAKAAPTSVFGATASLLPTGKVLLAGGTVGSASTAQTWLYDPVGDAFTAGKPLAIPRSEHTATLLRNGRVLVAGGFDSTAGGLLSSAELYDPVTGNWAPTGGMGRTHSGHSATLLTDGRVLLIDQTSAELYDPSSGAWSAADAPVYSHYDTEATLLADGTVLIAGGFFAAGAGNPPSERWTPTTTLRTPAPVDFGALVVGSASDAVGVTIRNTGTSPLLVDSVTADGDYSLAADHCAAPVAPGGSCTVDVRFGPVTVGERAGTLRIRANTAQREHTVALRGVGNPAPVPPPVPRDAGTDAAPKPDAGAQARRQDRLPWPLLALRALAREGLQGACDAPAASQAKAVIDRARPSSTADAATR